MMGRGIESAYSYMIGSTGVCQNWVEVMVTVNLRDRVDYGNALGVAIVSPFVAAAKLVLVSAIRVVSNLQMSVLILVCGLMLIATISLAIVVRVAGPVLLTGAQELANL